MSGGACYFVPALDPRTKRIFSEYFARLKTSVFNITPDLDAAWSHDSEPNYGPWWWIYTSRTLAAMLEVANFQIHKSMPVWGGRSHVFLCEKKTTLS